MTEIERVKEQLKRLSLRTMAGIFEKEAEKAAKSQMSYTAFLARLIDEEVANKTDRSVNARIVKAHFPAIKTLESFDFTFQPTPPEISKSLRFNKCPISLIDNIDRAVAKGI